MYDILVNEFENDLNGWLSSRLKKPFRVELILPLALKSIETTQYDL